MIDNLNLVKDQIDITKYNINSILISNISYNGTILAQKLLKEFLHNFQHDIFTRQEYPCIIYL